MDREMERGIEWNCQKTWRQYYHHVDHHEFEKAVELFTEDGIVIYGRPLIASGFGD